MFILVYQGLATLSTLQGYISVQGCVQIDVLSGNFKIKYDVLFRLLTQTIEAPKKRNKNKPYVVQAQYENPTEADAHLNYHRA